jgi:hypothetical protein
MAEVWMESLVDMVGADTAEVGATAVATMVKWK